MQLRNLAVIAHVDHGKTTLTDRLLYQSGMFRQEELDKLCGGQHGLIMDSGDLERERGITITAKTCSIRWTSPVGVAYKFNLIDTPGHADFGGEVERVLNMADGCLLVVDSFEGPMPQTRFVLSKALALGLKPILVINKSDKPSARPDEVVNEVFDLLVSLNAPDHALDFPVVYASARDGWATTHHSQIKENRPTNMLALYETIAAHIPAPYAPGSSRGAAAGYSTMEEALAAPLQMMITSLAYSDYVGRIGVGRVSAGTVRNGQTVAFFDRNGKMSRQRIQKLESFEGLKRVEVDSASAGDICAVIGVEGTEIGATIACPDNPKAMPPIKVDEPTITMSFRVNDSPFAGKDPKSKFVTGRQIWDRLEKELEKNVALRIARDETSDAMRVSGRGLLHLGILIETMRREGFELQVGKPEVILKQIDGQTCEPMETLIIDCPEGYQGDVMGAVLGRKCEIISSDNKAGAHGWIHMEFKAATRSLIGLRTQLMTKTKGEAIIHHTILGYEPVKIEPIVRPQGVMIQMDTGSVTAYSLDRLFDRGSFFVSPGMEVYEGQIVGEHCKDTDIPVNAVIKKQLSNMRTTSKDEAAKIKPAREMSLENCMEYIEDDELVEIVPSEIRMRKKWLKESDRKRNK